LTFQKKDNDLMLEAIKIAKKGLGKTKTNPLVGAVVSSGGEIISKGFHEKYGQNHAEINALEKVDVKNTTLHVTLEPCSHHGKTPPCINKIISKNVKRVVIGTKDPNKKVNGKGIKKLKEAGIDVSVGCLKDQCNLLNYSYLTGILKGRASVTVKVATSIDGKVAAADGTSQWITSKNSREDGKSLRNEHDAIMVGSGTVIKDNPKLDRKSAIEEWKKILIDRNEKVKKTSKIFKNGNVYLWGTGKEPSEGNIHQLKIKSLKELLEEVRKKGIQSVLCEGGKLAGELIKQGLADRIIVYMSPKIIGSKGIGFSPDNWTTLSESKKLSNVSIKTIGNNVRMEGYLTNVHRDN